MDLKTSVLINRQVPEFVREDYPLFIEFLEAYYEFLETKQGIKQNDLLTEAKELLYNFDVDRSVDQFESHFFNVFAPYITNEMVSDKAFFIKNVLNLYQTKGSEKSVKFLFKLIFGKDAEILYPKNNILIASDGKWVRDIVIKIEKNVSSVYIGDGITTQFTLLNCKGTSPYNNIIVTVDNVLTVDYVILQEYNLIIFNNPVASGSEIEVLYDNVEYSELINRKLIGRTTGASVISEKVYQKLVNNQIIYEIYVDSKTLIGEFQIGEELDSSVFVNDVLVNIRCKTISELNDIIITNPGAYYNVGDPVIIESPGAVVQPTAIITKVSKGQINGLFIAESGAGFDANGKIFLVDAENNEIGLPLVDISIVSVLGSDEYLVDTSNTFTIFSTVIDDINPDVTTIDAADYGITGGTYSGNANSVIARTFANTSYTNIGQISGIEITKVDVNLLEEPKFNAEPAKLLLSNNYVYINTFGSIGKLKIINPGEGYAVGEELIFTNAESSWGFGAAAEIKQVGANNSIEVVKLVPPKILGTANGSSSSVTVVGTNTLFTTELYPGCSVMINNETKIVDVITSNTSINVSSAFATSFTNKPVRLYGKYLIGGQGYEQTTLPTITIDSIAGSNGVIEAVAIMGDGEAFDVGFSTSGSYGGINEITIINSGSGIQFQPSVDLTGYGDGTAIATVELVPSYIEFPGRWKNSDGKISAEDIRLQDNKYYHKHAHVISSEIEFVKYKQMIKELIHPAGTVGYGQLNTIVEFDTGISVDIESSIEIFT